MNVPDKTALDAQTYEHNDELHEEIWLGVESCDSLRRSADFSEPVKAAHVGVIVIGFFVAG